MICFSNIPSSFFGAQVFVLIITCYSVSLPGLHLSLPHLVLITHFCSLPCLPPDVCCICGCVCGCILCIQDFSAFSITTLTRCHVSFLLLCRCHYWLSAYGVWVEYPVMSIWPAVAENVVISLCVYCFLITGLSSNVLLL